MKLINKRLASDKESTLGLLLVNGKKFGFVIEDEHRDVKFKDETRIPAGFYRIQFRKALTPLTQKYRAKFDWFSWHLELQNVPKFSAIYIHIGNFESSTSGCQIIGNKAGFDKRKHFRNFESTDCFKRLYFLVSQTLKRGEKVWYEVREE